MIRLASTLSLLFVVACGSTKGGAPTTSAPTDDTPVTGSTAGGKTEAQCKAADDCALYGLCGAKDGVCVATSSGCEASGTCGMSGFCTEKDGKCVVTESSCKEKVCAVIGLCGGIENGKCVGKDDDCRTSRCKERGECTLSPDKQACLVDEPSCKASDVCKKEGKCKPDKIRMSCEG